MMLVIADDLTGAAEVAGLAWRIGLRAAVASAPSGAASRLRPSTADLLALNTDSRSLPPAAAADRLRTVCLRARRELKPSRLFKKIDSAFRGPIGAEIEACLGALGLRSALVIPASPGTGRVTVGGVHLIAGIPLAQTEFAHDPQWPAHESHLPSALASQVTLPVRAAASPLGARLAGHGITIGDATTEADLRRWAEALPDTVLPVGSAAFGAALLCHWSGVEALPPPRPEDFPALDPPVLVVSGSLSAVSRSQIAPLRAAGVPGISLGPDTAQTASNVLRELSEQGRAALTSHDTPPPPAAAPAICARLAAVVSEVLTRADIGALIVEGGETAGCLVRRMGWESLEVLGEYAQGVVLLRPTGAANPSLLVKPGSYGSEDLYLRLT